MGGVLYPIMKVFPMQIRANAEDSARMMLKELKILDDHLSTRSYLVGDELTIADSAHRQLRGARVSGVP